MRLFNQKIDREIDIPLSGQSKNRAFNVLERQFSGLFLPNHNAASIFFVGFAPVERFAQLTLAF